MDKLKLKIIVHSGEALFYKIEKFNELSGVDVIIVHKLLKNSVSQDEYILLTESAYYNLEFSEAITLQKSEENYADLGIIKTFIYIPSLVEETIDNQDYKNKFSGIHFKIKNTLIKMLNNLLILLKIRKIQKLPKIIN